MEKYKLPTGYVFTDEYSKGKLETLSIGDYGKENNVKADFLGLEREINGVPNGPTKPLSEKWVITMSTQYGCPMRCSFCDVPKLGFNGNASYTDLKDQFFNGLDLFPEVKHTERLNIHFARMGEPVFNDDIIPFTKYLYKSKEMLRDTFELSVEVIHPVFTTMCPMNRMTSNKICKWAIEIKNNLYNGQAGLQLSINSTNEEQRDEMFNGKQMILEEISKIGERLPIPIGRKYCLNFALADDYEVDGRKLRRLFDPDKFMVKITPIHNNSSCRENGIETYDGYNNYAPYKRVEEELKSHGFDVLVFIPSSDEEDSQITCGNAILSENRLNIN